MISLLIPFASKEQRRVHIFEWVLSRWARLHPEFELCVGLGEEDNFNRSAARNQAFRQSHGDILVLTDADTACPSRNVKDAISLVSNGVPWVIAHDRYYSLTQEYTDMLLAERPEVALEPLAPFNSDWMMTNRSHAGVIVMPRDAWVGYDERFQGWGYEDNEFAVRLDRKRGLHQRVKGPMLHLWHPRGDADFSQPHIKENEQIYNETVAAG